MRKAIKYEKVIRDPLYDYIGITKEHLQVIQLPIFQRLRRISQLSFGDIVYPNASHNRFSHSLGVMHLAEVFMDYLEASKMDEQIGLGTADKEAFVWAALLHDIGHLPFSHVSEAAFADFFPEIAEAKNFHVKIGCEIIKKEEFGIKQVIGEEIVEKVCELLNGKAHPLLDQMLNGIASIDRLDYLKRDAYHAGTPEYSVIDAKRIITSIVLYPGHSSLAPVFRKKALYSLEGVALSYFFLYRAIYYHHTVRAAYLLFQDILWEALEKYGLEKILREADWLASAFFSHFDDHYLLTILRQLHKDICNRLEELLFRNLPKMISPESLTKIAATKIGRFVEKNPLLKDKIEKERHFIEELGKQYSVKRLLLDSPLVFPYPPSLLTAEAKVIYLWEDGWKEPIDLGAASPYLRSLADTAEAQLVGRVYVSPDDLRNNPDFINDLKSVLLKSL